MEVLITTSNELQQYSFNSWRRKLLCETQAATQMVLGQSPFYIHLRTTHDEEKKRKSIIIKDSRDIFPLYDCFLSIFTVVQKYYDLVFFFFYLLMDSEQNELN